MKADRPAAQFRVSLYPEIFYALQALSTPTPATHDPWRQATNQRYPASALPLDCPPIFWPAFADTAGPIATESLDALLDTIARTGSREFQQRFLEGLLHHGKAATSIIDGTPPSKVIAELPRQKREWLAFAELFPLDPRSKAAITLHRVVREPESVRGDLIATLREFHDAIFAEQWRLLHDRLAASTEVKRKLFEALPLAEFLRHTLLPIELDEKANVLRALRGGYELPVAEIERFVFTPSVFNTRRLWTTFPGRDGSCPWLPYLEPDAGVPIGVQDTIDESVTADPALVLRALGDTTRFALLTLVGRQPRTSIELANLLSVSRATISHHLHTLRAAGLVRETEHGGATLLSLRREPLARLSEELIEHFLESTSEVEPSTTRSRT